MSEREVGSRVVRRWHHLVLYWCRAAAGCRLTTSVVWNTLGGSVCVSRPAVGRGNIARQSILSTERSRLARSAWFVWPPNKMSTIRASITSALRVPGGGRSSRSFTINDCVVVLTYNRSNRTIITLLDWTLTAAPGEQHDQDRCVGDRTTASP